MKISNKIVIDALQEVSDKSSRLTGNALGVAEELFNPLIGHLHEMVLIEPANIFSREMQCNREDCLTRNLAGFSRMFEATIGVGTFFSLAGEVSTQLDGQILWKSFGKTSGGLMLGFLR